MRRDESIYASEKFGSEVHSSVNELMFFAVHVTEKFLLRESMRNGFVVVGVVWVSRQSANCRNTSL